MFGQPIPTLNNKGKTEIHTSEGVLISVILLTVMFLFGAMKLEHLVTRHNPQVSSTTYKNFFDSMQKWTLEEKDFMFAFAIEGYYSKEDKTDPNYVKMFAQTETFENGQRVNE